MSGIKPPADIESKLLHVLHLGCVEIRSLSRNEANVVRIADLADILEVIPTYLMDWRDECFELVVSDFKKYMKHDPPAKFDYLHALDLNGPDEL